MYKIELPPKNKIIKTSLDDSGPERYYAQSKFVRKIYLERLQIAIDLVHDKKYENLLEIGYGNGLLFPTLKKFALNSYGIDIHGREKEISEFFPGNFINGSVYDIPFPEKKFDCIFCLSVIEHLNSLEKIFGEIKKAASYDADIIFGIPSDNIFMKLFFWIKRSPALKSHINSKKKLIKLISRSFSVKEKKILRVMGIDVYTALRCRL